MDQQNQQATKRCPYCAKEILTDAVRCSYCGMSLDKQALHPISSVPTVQQFSNVQPIWHFSSLYIFSFGLYSVYWFYKNWKFIKERNKLNISPFWRAIFHGIFAYSLFKKILVQAKEKGYTENYSPGFLTILYIIIVLLRRLPEPYWLISFFSIVPLTMVINALNYHWRQEQPNLKERTNFSGKETALLVIGGILWIFALVGLFFP